MKKVFYIIAVLLLMGSTRIFASDTKPIQFSLFNPVQMLDENASVKGVRLSLFYGVNDNITGVDYGLIYNRVKKNVIGGQSGLVNNVGGNFGGQQSGAVNITNGNFNGLQFGLVNLSKGGFVGVQVGVIYNYAGTMNGIQLGLINNTENLSGLQIGLVNINGSKDPFMFLPFVNFSFK